MGASHKYRPTRIRKHEDLHQGREPGKASKAIVQPEGYPKLFRMHQEGYLNSAIGRAFGVSGTTAGKLIRKYEAILEAGI